jgi:hypothetical protein
MIRADFASDHKILPGQTFNGFPQGDLTSAPIVDFCGIEIIYARFEGCTDNPVYVGLALLTPIIPSPE